VHIRRFLRTLIEHKFAVLAVLVGWSPRCTTYRAMKGMLVCLALVGCHGTDIAPPDSQPASDALGDTHSLAITWVAQPGIPGPLNNTITVTAASFKVARVQAIGDAGGASRDDLVVGWALESSPPPIVLPDAPTGIYSKVTLAVDGGTALDIAYQIEGTVKLNGQPTPFEIHDRNAIDIEVKDFDVTLPPVGTATLAIKLDLGDALDNIDYGNLDVDDGKLMLDTSDAQMPDFRSDLKKAFTRAN
jgi:hypothetical protein